MVCVIETKTVYYVKDTLTGQTFGPIHDKAFAQSFCNQNNQKHTDNPYSLKTENHYVGTTISGTI
mgnify:CR=1 FL=1